MIQNFILLFFISTLFSDNNIPNRINKIDEKNILNVSPVQNFQHNTNFNNLKRAPLNPEYLSFINTHALGRTSNYTFNDLHLGYIPPPIKINFNSNYRILSENTLPASYDLRIENYLTPVRDQGDCGACWAFASYGSIESSWKQLGLGNFNLSENNANCGNGFEYGMCHGGNAHLASAYLARGNGPISELDDPYLGTSGVYIGGLNPLAYITGARYLPNTSDIIKQAIYNHGALYTSIHVADSESGETYDEYMNSDNTYYYDGNKPTNHAVALVGWDDNKVVNRAPGNGAWICKNSWGDNWGDNGFFYISYYDTKANEEVAYWPNRIDYTENIIIHQYDTLGWIHAVGYTDSTAYGLIKFNINKEQTLDRIGTWIVSSNATIDIEIYDTFDGTNLSGSLYALNNQSCAFPGYYTFELETPLELASDDIIYVKIKYTTPNHNYPIPLEREVDGYADPDIEEGVFWISHTGSNWKQLGNNIDNWNDDPCVKLYGKVDLTTDCAGVPNGNSVVDHCGTCDSDSSNDCVQDCAGTWGGTAVDDACGVCGGDGPDEGFTCEGGPLSIYNNLIPEKYNIHTIYPNPFNPITNISFSIPDFGLITITAYNIQGRKMETLVNKILPVGNYSIKWNASNYTSGIYLIKMKSSEFTKTQKVVLVK